MDDNVARVFLVGGGSRAVRYDDETTVERILQVVLKGIGVSSVAAPHFSLRLYTTLSSSGSGESTWLHPKLSISNIRHVYARHLYTRPISEELKFELRLRFIPQSAYELLLTESKAFFYLHDQVFDDFLSHVAWKINQETALELAALKICRDYSEKQPRTCVDHKIDIDGIDIDYAMQTFIPKTVLCNPNIKPSALKKQLLSLLKKFADLPSTDSLLQSLTILIDIVKFDVELFKASLGIGWSSPIDLLVGPDVGVSYRTNERCDVCRLTELRSVLEITIRKIESSSEKTVVQLKLSGNAQPLFITVATQNIAESLAHLIDGYQMLYNQGDSVFKMKGLERCESVQLRQNTLPNSPIGIEPDLRIKRENVTLKELLGGGQFGNVYKGILTEPHGRTSTVAIKVCKLENEPADTQLVLQESHLMKSLRHEHIISLVGVCMDSPMWIIMELAPLGELRQYLQNNANALDLTILIQFSHQVSNALQYLHDNSFVHRDVAARNVLVSSAKCVKLTDFGLSRSLDYDAVYTASRGKLPIKWLAPESINFREFSMASDVWMFGVCLWEILSWGVKPWQGVQNADVISKIEAGLRPKCPTACPQALYNYLESYIWAIEPGKRPTMDEVEKVLESILQQIKFGTSFSDIKVTRALKNAPIILTKIDSLPALTLWRTLEEQRRQAEEDEKWLEEQEDLALCYPEASCSDIRNGMSSLNLLSHEVNGNYTKIPHEQLFSVKRSSSAVRTAVDHLNNTFNKEMKHDHFVLSIRDITSKLRDMFGEATQIIAALPDHKKHEIEKTEALIGNDMSQMSSTMQKLLSDMDQPSSNILKREIVRIARDLSTNCQNFYSLLEQQSQPTSRTEFRAVLSDC
ncbi:unnamed protein product [Auanema sp. JU1783]|nr:unnamed protein product [Auanema sp. JU1783]